MAHSVLSAFIPEACPNLNKSSFDLKKLPNDSAVDQKQKDRRNEKNLIARSRGHDAGRSVLSSRRKGSGRRRRRGIQFFAGAVV
jgi:hypothetical protein